MNGTNYGSYLSTNLMEMSNAMPVFEYDEIYRQYRTDTRKREPQFLGFDIQDDNIEIDMEIAVPFLSVPKRGALGKRNNLANINVAAVILAGFVALGGTLLGGAARFFKGDQFFGGKPWFRTGNKKKKEKRDIGHEDYLWDLMDNVNQALLDIDFDFSSCMARSVCWHVKNSVMNVQENRAQKIDKFIAGFSGASWVHRMISNKALLEAMNAGRRGVDCEIEFKSCALNSANVEKFAKSIQQKAAPKRK